MTDSPAPIRDVARFIAAITASRKTSIDDVPALIASVRGALAGLATLGQQEIPAKLAAPIRRRKVRKAAAVAAAAPKDIAAAPRRPRGRPRLTEVPTEDRARRPEPAAAAPVAPRLMRRA